MKLDTVICIGAGLSQLPYIEEVKKRGYHLICADQNPNSPGFELADDYVVSSTFDYKKTTLLISKKIGGKNKIKSVIAPCTGPPLRTAQELRRLFDLPHYDHESLNILLDKLYFRKYCNSIGCSNISVFNDRQMLPKDCFPLVKKPRFGGMGGQDVRIYTSLDDFRKVNYSVETKPEFVYERLVYGKEIAVDAIWDGNSLIFLNVGWTLFHTELGIVVGSTSQHDDTLNSLNFKINETLHKFCSSLKLGPEVLNVDIMLDSENSLHLIEVEFAPADGIPLCKEAFQYDLVKNYVSTYLGCKIQAQPKRKKSVALICSIRSYSRLKSVEQIDSKSTLSFGDFYPVRPYEVQTKNGPMVVNGYYLVSNVDAGQLITSIKNTFPKISLSRFDND